VPYPAAPPPTDAKAIVSLILGIMSIAFCLTIFSGIPAVILGHISLSSIRKSMGRLKGNGLATAGLVLGYIGIVFGLLYIAVLIPNLTRQSMQSNAAEAASSVRTISSAQHTYSLSYPAKGYAADLAALGPGPGGKCSGAEFPAEHACLLDNVLGNASCTAGVWCTKGAYRFSMSANCEAEGPCKDYVVVATPISARPISRSICATSDSTLRVKRGEPLSSPITVEECQSWTETM
jgi:type II secretory pathway pseudopilin PulG